MERSMFIVVMVIFLSTLIAAALSADAGGWYDTFYQYRIPVVVEAEQAGWHTVPIDAAVLTDAINENEEMKFDPLWLAYNQLKIVETDAQGIVIHANVKAGFYLVPDGEELFTESLTGSEQQVEIPTEKDAYYLVTYQSQGGGGSPLYEYEQIWPVGTQIRKHAYMSSYEPPLLQQALKKYERLLLADGQPMLVHVKNRFTGEVKSVSVKKVKIAFLAEIDAPGKKNWMIYYQPMLGHYLTIPQMRHTELVQNKTSIEILSRRAEKYLGKTAYRLAENDYVEAWFADSTIKLTPETPAPQQSSAAIHITAAKNEAQSFQVVIRPKQPFKLAAVKMTDLSNDNAGIPALASEIYVADYVPIVRKSYITPTAYLGKIADPLVSVAAQELTPQAGNYILWITVKAPADTPAGTYKGTLEIKGDDGSMTLPVTLDVYDFALPEYSTFQSGLGGQFFIKNLAENANNMLKYHGLKTKAELKKLVRLYYDIMAANKFYPKSVALYSEIGMNWSPPPMGYNVDAPDNFFKLHDWDFSELNEDLKHYIDDLKVNSVCLTHTDPTSCNTFQMLPGKELDAFSETAPHVTMGWQTFRENTFVAWDVAEGQPNPYDAIEISIKQFDRLTLDYYRAIAENLDKHGWLDKFYICIDETSNVKRLLHFLRLLKSDPLTARIKVIACMQSLEYFDYKEKPEDKEYAFNGLLTYMPQNDENYNRWEKYFFTDYGINTDRSNLWNYAVNTTRLTLDVPGINNRIIGLDIFNRGGSGFFVWDTIGWDSPYGDLAPWPQNSVKNPWVDPHTRYGNGILCFFYPPRPDGVAPQPDYTITPSLRIMTYRESIDDYEYARILENLMIQAKQRGIDLSDSEAIMKDIERFFAGSVHWSQNNAWYLELRDRIAAAIVTLQKKIQ